MDNDCNGTAKISAPIYSYGWAGILAHIAVRFLLKKQRCLAWHCTNKIVPSAKFWQRSHESILCLWQGERPPIHLDQVPEKYTASFLNSAVGKIRKQTTCRYSNKGEKAIYETHPQDALPRDVLKVAALAGSAGSSAECVVAKITTVHTSTYQPILLTNKYQRLCLTQ